MSNNTSDETCIVTGCGAVASAVTPEGWMCRVCAASYRAAQRAAERPEEEN